MSDSNLAANLDFVGSLVITLAQGDADFIGDDLFPATGGLVASTGAIQMETLDSSLGARQVEGLSGSAGAYQFMPPAKFLPVQYATRAIAVAVGVTDARERDFRQKGLASLVTRETRRVYRQVRRLREQRAADFCLTTANWTGYAGSAPAAWTDAASDPVKDVITAYEAISKASLMDPNAIVFSREDMNILTTHPLFRSFGSSQEENMQVSRQRVRSVFEEMGMRVFEARARFNTANQGGTVSVASIWTPGRVWLGHIGGLVTFDAASNVGELDGATSGIRLVSQEVAEDSWLDKTNRQTCIGVACDEVLLPIVPAAGGTISAVSA